MVERSSLSDCMEDSDNVRHTSGHKSRGDGGTPEVSSLIVFEGSVPGPKTTPVRTSQTVLIKVQGPLSRYVTFSAVFNETGSET